MQSCAKYVTGTDMLQPYCVTHGRPQQQMDKLRFTKKKIPKLISMYDRELGKFF